MNDKVLSEEMYESHQWATMLRETLTPGELIQASIIIERLFAKELCEDDNSMPAEAILECINTNNTDELDELDEILDGNFIMETVCDEIKCEGNYLFITTYMDRDSITTVIKVRKD